MGGKLHQHCINLDDAIAQWQERHRRLEARYETDTTSLSAHATILHAIIDDWRKHFANLEDALMHTSLHRGQLEEQISNLLHGSRMTRPNHER
jgi:hypothetical protein